MRVAFYCQLPFHRAILEQAYNLSGRYEHITPLWIENPGDLIAKAPRIIVYPDLVEPEVRRALPADTLYIYTRHGFAMKNYLYSQLLKCDVACVSCRRVMEDLMKCCVTPCLGYWVTGFPATDSLWQRMQRPNKPKAGTTILYAPTWNPELSAHPVIGTSWISAWVQTKGNRVIIKPHAHITRKTGRWLTEFKTVAAKHSDSVQLVDKDADIFPLLPEGDLLLTDLSSVMFFYLALDRPIVLVDPPLSRPGARFDRYGPEWRWRDMGLRVTQAEQLLPILDQAATNPIELSARRHYYRDRVYGNRFDGRASERLAAHIAAIAPTPSKWPQNPRRHTSQKRRLICKVKKHFSKIWR